MDKKELLIYIGEAVLIIYVLVNLPLAGIALIALRIHIHDRIKNLERQRDAAIQEDDEEALTKGLDNVEVKGNVSSFNIHEECVIENYHDKFFRILKPSGEYLPKIFLSENDAVKEINLVSGLLPKTKKERSKIYNFRYVK
jgi:hypothetical protein